MNTAQLRDRDTAPPGRESGEATTGGVLARGLAPGATVAGKYVVRGELGRGGFAVVYDAEHLGLGRRVAIKVVHLADDMPVELLVRARREARNAALVRHPNILEVFDTGALDDGSPYLVMERIQGETLGRRILRQVLTIPAAVELGKQLLLALEALANHDIVHRDIKPENVMLHDGGDGRLIVKLVDFGIAKRTVKDDVRLTRDGTLVGTPSYMSPEQLRGEELDRRTDIYSAGAVLYEALTGRPPHDRASVEEVMLATLHDTVRPIRPCRADCPPELERIVLKALAKSREDRYPTAAAMRAELQELAEACRLPVASKAWRALQPVSPMAGLPATTSTSRSKLASLLARVVERPPPIRMLVGGFVLVLLAMGAALAKHASSGATPAVAVASPEVASTRPTATLAVAEAPVHELRPVSTAPVVASAVEPVRGTARSERRPRRPPTKTAAPARTVAVAAPAAVADAVEPLPTPRPVVPVAAGQGARPLIKAALAAFAHGQLSVAEERFRSALAIDRREPDAWRGLGLVAARRGDHAQARTALARYLELAPTAPDAEAIRARLLTLPPAH